jgi:hypothetical protein
MGDDLLSNVGTSVKGLGSSLLGFGSISGAAVQKYAKQQERLNKAASETTSIFAGMEDAFGGVDEAAALLRVEEDGLVKAWENGSDVLRRFIGVEEALNLEMRIAAIHARGEPLTVP